MPIYEYQCQKCGHQFETIRKVSDEPLTTCPSCATESLKKLVSKAAFRLKGGGWYETDFKSGNKKNVLGEDKKGGTDGASSGDAGAAKTATDAPAKSSSDAAKPSASSTSE